MLSASRYVPGLIGLGIVWVLANWMTNASVDRDLTARVTAALPRDALSQPQVAIAGRDATISGAAFSPSGSMAASSIAAETYGVRLVNSQISALASAKPYAFSAVRQAGKLTLTGNVPDPASRAKIMVAAKATMGSGEIVDQMAYAGGAPSNFDAMSSFAVSELGYFSAGNSSLSDASYTISGQVASADAFDAAKAGLAKLGAGMVLAKSDIQPSPEMVAAAAVAKAKADQEVAAAAKAKADQEAAAAAKVKADQEAVSAAKAKADQEVAAAAKAKADDAATKAKAKAEQEAAAAAVVELDVSGCQALFNDMLAKNVIVFETGRANIDPQSAPFLSILAKVAKRCPNARIEVGGHTDSDGNEDSNMALSTRRAEAVVAYLVKEGVAQELLSAKGFGDTQPIASNDTADGKGKNRRIEFIVSN